MIYNNYYFIPFNQNKNDLVLRSFQFSANKYYKFIITKAQILSLRIV